MAEILEVDLKHQSTGELHPAVVRDLDIVKDVLLWYMDWFPEMYDLSSNRIYEDSHWEVSRIWEHSVKETDDRILIIERDGKIQGYVVLKVSDYVGIDGNPCSYAKFLASAPWNRKKQKEAERLYCNTGTMLLGVCIVVGYWTIKQTALELESLPGAETFYRKCGMLPTGRQKNGMLQYRFDSKTSVLFFEKIKNSIRPRRV
jgi:hypothetical protein